MKLQRSGAPVRYRRHSKSGEYARFWDDHHLPCQQPPWGTLNAIDVNTGEIAWKVPLGAMPDCRLKTGTPSLGGTIVTGGLVFIGGTTDSHFRAFDCEDRRRTVVRRPGRQRSRYADDLFTPANWQAIRGDRRRRGRKFQQYRFRRTGGVCPFGALDPLSLYLQHRFLIFVTPEDPRDLARSHHMKRRDLLKNAALFATVSAHPEEFLNAFDSTAAGKSAARKRSPRSRTLRDRSG